MGRVPRRFAVVAVLAIAALLCAFSLRHVLKPADLELRLADTTLPADGFSSTELSVRAINGASLHDLWVEAGEAHRATVEAVVVDKDSARVSVRAGVLPGETKFRVGAPGYPVHEVSLRTVFDAGDSARDGTPDFLRLHDPADRAAFRRWFTLLAEAQYFRGSALPAEVDDCAALLRFSYREALRAHDANWARQMALPVPASAADVRQYQVPFTPLGASIFRVREGSFEKADLHDGSFAEFADAKTLSRYDSFFLGRDLNRARPGDLLFFRQDGHSMPYHAMVFVGRSQIGPGRAEYVVYHTGPIGKSAGELRRVSVAELMNHPEARWHPVASNPNFLGVYRWNILRGDQ